MQHKVHLGEKLRDHCRISVQFLGLNCFYMCEYLYVQEKLFYIEKNTLLYSVSKSILLWSKACVSSLIGKSSLLLRFNSQSDQTDGTEGNKVLGLEIKSNRSTAWSETWCSEKG